MLEFIKNPGRIIQENNREWGRTVEMSVKDLQKKYSGAALGYFWALFKPILFIFVYWFAIDFGIRGGNPVGEDPFILWLIAGIIPWFYVSEALTYGGTSIRQNKHLVTKMVYPVATIPTFRVLSLFYVHLAMTVIGVVIFALAGYYPNVHYFQLIYYNMALFLFMAVLSWTTSALVVISRDFEHFLKSIIRMVFWLTPIIWNVTNIETPLRYLIMANPIFYFVQGYRDSLLGEKWFFEDLWYTGYFWLVFFVLFFVGAYIFNKLRDEFPDIL
ncbi:MAG TPA: hypothetical protein DHN33_07625 [Eubacteriaceae bacterium]|nr:hypothetical protein [Eubacteriaceae bacterium]